MRTILAITKKELVTHLTTPWAWVVFTATSLIGGIFFIMLLFQFKEVQDAAASAPGGWSQLPAEAQLYRNLTDGIVINLWGSMMAITLFMAPFLSMRLLAEERRNKTFELLMTTPVRPIEIVLGKYFGAVAIMVMTIGVTIVFPIILTTIGTSESGSALEWKTVLLGFAALLLLGATKMSIGLFVSSLTESQMVAALVSFAIALGWLMVNMVVPEAEEPVRSIVNYLSYSVQMENLLKGILDLKPIVLFASVTSVFLMLTHVSLQAQRWS